MSESTARNRWNDLTNFLNEWFYRPNLEALECAFAACAGHFIAQADTIWLMVTGPAGSGKTSIVINCLSALPETHVESKITAQTFLSGFHGKKEAGLLSQVGPKPIFLFKDFTSILSMRDQDKAIIFADLREIYDGFIRSRYGTGSTYQWQGKATVIAGVTPAIERAWSLQRELGERFLQVRWGRQDGRGTGDYSRRQRGHEKDIREGMRELSRKFFSYGNTTLVPLAPDDAKKIDCLAELVARLRGHCVRDTYGERKIIDMPQIEEASRLIKSLDLAASAHAALFHLSTPTLRIPHRIALDTIPSNRLRIMRSLPLDGSTLTADAICAPLKLPRSTFDWQVDELLALEAITATVDFAGPSHYAIHPDFLPLIIGAGLENSWRY